MKTSGKTPQEIAEWFIKPDISFDPLQKNFDCILVGGISLRPRYGNDTERYLAELRRQLAKLITHIRNESEAK